MNARPSRLLARPLAERERRRVFAAVALGLLAAAAALTFIAPPREHRLASARPPAASVSAPALPTPLPSAPAGPPAVVVRAGRRFLHDYLPYLYGHTRARTFSAASGLLAASLASHPPRVSPAMRRRHPRFADLT